MVFGFYLACNTSCITMHWYLLMFQLCIDLLFSVKGSFSFLKLLLSKGANWNEKDNEGRTAMHLCTRHKSLKCLALLTKHLQLGAVDDQDSNKVTYLAHLKAFI